MALQQSVDADRAAKLAGLVEEQWAARTWIEGVTGEPFPAGDSNEAFATHLKDGQV